MRDLQTEWVRNGIRYVTGDHLIMTIPRSNQGQLQGRPDCMFVVADFILTVAQSIVALKTISGVVNNSMASVLDVSGDEDVAPQRGNAWSKTLNSKSCDLTLSEDENNNCAKNASSIIPEVAQTQEDPQTTYGRMPV